MRFKVVKKGFEPIEVDLYIKRLRQVYDKTLVEQRDRIFEQRDYIESLELQLQQFSKNKEKVSESLSAAVEKSQEMEGVAKDKYAKELVALREFHEVWVNYFAHIKDKYPLDAEITNLADINDKIDKVLAEADTFVPRKGDGFNPINMIESMLAATEVEQDKGSSLFNYELAQNPEDDLADILGDLGISACVEADNN